ncbi:C-type mannose receptor 2 [Sebastes umbrosus]|uniref:C-type mannose receptor 2 n=1 Tax=Sebastes umbrosus TaxID=72105 RepID=UPI0018A0D48A|nr:C-type mannose receptor 2 [Sebastes umbrosus]
MIMTENRRIVKEGTQTLYLLFISGFCSFALGSSDFHLITISKNYTEAKTYCREMYTDLATVHNSTDMDNLITLVPSTTARAWIGLETGDVRMWHWSWPDQKLDYFNWKAGEPQINNEDACAAMDQHSEWIESDCGTKRSFVCHGNSNTSGLIFVAETKSWRDAQNYCRGLSSDLISIHSAKENEAVHNVSVSQNVWIGLFKDPWKWSDGSESSFRYWKPNQPNYRRGQNCAAAIFKDEGQWNDLNCAGKRKFVCRGARKSIPTSTIQTSTQDTPANLTTVSNTSSQEVMLTYHLTVDTTNQSHTTNVTTEEAKTNSEPTTPNTTDLVSNTSSTELNNATTEMTTVTATQQPLTTTAQVTPDSVSTLTTLMGTSAQNTTQFSTLKPTENSFPIEMTTVTATQQPLTTTAEVTPDGVSTLTTLMEISAQNTTQSSTLKPIENIFPTGNLILIQENMTWIEAMDYCREHHIDLVQITTKDIQGKVAEMANNATSPHVWLGLRYTCKFNFWFWTKSTTGCYQNWAPGQGSEGKYDCGATGAIEATGRQQWVGLPETEQLNFICYACTG